MSAYGLPTARAIAHLVKNVLSAATCEDFCSEPNQPTDVLGLEAKWASGRGRLMIPDRIDSARWSALADEAQTVAAQMNNPQARQIMLKIAEAYRRLARLADAREKKSN